MISTTEIKKRQKILDLVSEGHTVFYSLDASRTDLHGTEFLPWTNFKKSCFDFANLSDVVMNDVSFDEAKMRRVNMAGGSFAGAHFPNAEMAFADASGANLTGANLRGANLNGVKFDNAVMDRADLRGASLVGASFADVDLTNICIDRQTQIIPTKWMRTLNIILQDDRYLAIAQEYDRLTNSYPDPEPHIDLKCLATLHVDSNSPNHEDAITRMLQQIPLKEKDQFLQQWSQACQTQEILSQIDPVQAMVMRSVLSEADLVRRKTSNYIFKQQEPAVDSDTLETELLSPEQKQSVQMAAQQQIGLEDIVQTLQAPADRAFPEAEAKSADTMVHTAIRAGWPSIAIKGGGAAQQKGFWIEATLQGINIDYAASDYRPDDAAMLELGAKAKRYGVCVTYNASDGSLDMASVFGKLPLEGRQIAGPDAHISREAQKRPEHRR